MAARDPSSVSFLRSWETVTHSRFSSVSLSQPQTRLMTWSMVKTRRGFSISISISRNALFPSFREAPRQRSSMRPLSSSRSAKRRRSGARTSWRRMMARRRASSSAVLNGLER